MCNSNAFQANSGGGHPRSNLASVKLMGRKKGQENDLDVGGEAQAAPDAAGVADAAAAASRRTGPKGRPTPKRNDARRTAKKGPVAPAPMTASEARARRKSLAGPKLSREERRADRTARRARMSERRDRGLAGSRGFRLPPNGARAPRYVRDVVDSRRFGFLGLFMPSALALLFLMF